MQIRRALPLAAASAVAAVAVTALAGCSLHGTPSASTLPAPSPSEAPTKAPSARTTPTEPPVTSSAPATTKPAAPHTSATPTKSPTAPATPTTAPPPTEPSTTAYDDLTLTLPVSSGAVPGAPAGFTAYATQALTGDWQKLGSTSGCQKAPQLIVQKISSNGYALVGRNINPALPDCAAAANEAGGYQAILQGTNGVWKQLVALQDAPSCKQMTKLGVPKSIYGQCY
jgi:hypothetical protein